MSNKQDTHRLMQLHSTVKKYHDRNGEDSEKTKEVAKGIEDAYARAVNQLANTEDGKVFLQILLAYSGVFKYNDNINPTQELVDSVKKRVWLEMIRPYLKKENIMKVEV